MDNIRTTDSDYRLHRMNELLDRAGKVDHQKAAGILRDTLGLQDKLIGLTNEKSINQFIAHHSVIFKPQELKMWVTTSPWQMGEFVMYDLAEIFGKMDSTKITVSSVDAALSIESDAGLFSGTYANVLDYRRIKDEIGSAMRKGETVDPQVLEIFLQTNAEYYYTYELLGDYYFSQDKPTEALRYWQTALTKEIPRLGDKENIEKKIRKNNRK